MDAINEAMLKRRIELAANECFKIMDRTENYMSDRDYHYFAGKFNAYLDILTELSKEKLVGTKPSISGEN